MTPRLGELRYLDRTQIAALFQAAKSAPLRDRILLTFLYRFGLRLSEACNLPADAVNTQRGTVAITGLKGGTTRVYPLPSDIRYLIRSYRPEGEFYFSSRQSVQLGRGRAHLIVKGLMRKAGMPPWATAHTLRHSVAVAALEAGAQLVEVKELLRHVRIGSTERYAVVGALQRESYFKRLQDSPSVVKVPK